MTNVIVASCDDAYARLYLPPLLGSAIIFNQPVVCRVINASPDTEILLRKVASKSPLFTFEFEVIDLDRRRFSDIQKKVYYASARYDAAADWIYDNRGGALVLDVDSFLNRPIDWDLMSAPLGIWDREDENLGNTPIEKAGMKVIACCYSQSEIFFQDVYDTIKRNKFDYWFLDQVAIYQEWVCWKKANFPWLQLRGLGLIDWEFEDDSMIWTGKGNRKFTNGKYIERSDELRHIFEKWINQ